MHWLYLFAAILSEVAGVMVMKLSSDDGSVWGFAVMAATISLSFYLLALAVKKIPIAVAYATWEGIGLMSITTLSVAFFGEGVSLKKIAGLILIFAGIVMMEKGIVDKEENETRETREKTV
ncbi:DMT family transporter [Burkholderia ubonensis]|uniref:DMT family transporter n=1 Tax=Burkholderia ubonensis TaxID=101571 RepID=UPI00075D5AD8|nr:multidrug efflux SMR transporter [Burkholderia ubonensis]KWN69270.1 hypothetical protein WM23_03995 [Burkholderia ubonensis]